MAEIKWILTCDGDCPVIMGKSRIKKCPQDCPNSHYEKEQPNTEVPSND